MKLYKPFVILALLLAGLFLWPNYVQAGVKTLSARALTGYTTSPMSLDRYWTDGDAANNYTALGAADMAIVVTSSNEMYVYRMADTGTAESVPEVIKPDYQNVSTPYAGNLRWHLVNESTKKDACIVVFDDTTTVTTTGDNEAIGMAVPATLNGWELIDVTVVVHTQGGTSGNTTVIPVRRRSGAEVNMCSTGVTVAYNAYYDNDETVNTSNDDLATGDWISIDVTGIPSGGAPSGLSATLTFRKP